MRIENGIAGVWRRFTHWVRTGEGLRDPDCEIDLSPPSKNEGFLADLDESQQMAVLSAIFAARRPISGPSG